jgi:sugar O-acyltransferase (sialic acid O-acetyltransferase NeuD family)
VKALWVVGAGGHAKVVIATARAAGFDAIQIADDDEARWGSQLVGAPIVGPTRDVLDRADAIAVLAIGDNAARHRLGASARCSFATVVHPSAIVDPSVVLGPGTVVFAGVVIQIDSRLGAHVIVNTGASIDHDCVLGDAVHVAPGTRLAGNVTLGDGVFVGIGAAIIPGRTVGAWTQIGAGAAVTRDLPEHVTAVGVPARPRGGAS